MHETVAQRHAVMSPQTVRTSRVGPGHPRHPAGRVWMQATDPDGQSSAPAPGVLGAVPAVDIDAIKKVSASNATYQDPASPATGAGSDDYGP